MKVLILGATGLVGKSVLTQALTHPGITRVIAPTRKSLAHHEKLHNPVAPEIDSFISDISVLEVDAVICALGTTMSKAGSKEAFYHVDYVLPLAFGTAAFQQGIETFAVVTAAGASASSRFFYLLTKGELERDLAKVGFTSLAIVRPSIIGGEREESRLLERVAIQIIGILGPVLPRSFRINPAATIAKALLEAVIAPRRGCHIVYSTALV